MLPSVLFSAFSVCYVQQWVMDEAKLLGNSTKVTAGPLLFSYAESDDNVSPRASLAFYLLKRQATSTGNSFLAEDT